MGKHGDYPDTWDTYDKEWQRPPPWAKDDRESGDSEPVISWHDTSPEADKLCSWINREIQQLTALTRQKASTEMNVGKYNTGGSGERLPLLDAKSFKKEAVNGTAALKVLAVREINTPGNKKEGKDPWHGIAVDLKAKSGIKYTYLASVDRFDIGQLCTQLGSEETDDWIGETAKFVLKKNRFVNVLTGKATASNGRKRKKA